MSDPIINKIVVYILLTFIACFFYFERFKEYGNFKRFSFGLIILATVYLGVRDIINTDRIAKKDKQDIINQSNSHTDSLFAYFNNTLTLAIQENAGNISKSIRPNQIPNTPQIPFALLRFSALNVPNPSIEKTDNPNVLLLKYRFSNYGTGRAYNLKLVSFFMDVVNGKIIIQKHFDEIKANESVMVYPNKNEGLPGFSTVTLSTIVRDSSFLCFKMDFTDSTKKRKAFIKILRVNFTTLEISEPTDSLYNAIESFLKKNKYWKTPFRQ